MTRFSALLIQSLIIIIMWLVQWRTLTFLRACSMPVDSAIGDRQLSGLFIVHVPTSLHHIGSPTTRQT